MNMRVTGSYPAGLTSPVDKRIGDAFPIIEEVYKHLSQLKYLAENSEKFVDKQIEFRANTGLGAIEWRYDGQLEWLVLVSYDDLVGKDFSFIEETLNQTINNGLQTITDKFIEGMTQYAGNIEAGAAWVPVPSHANAQFDAQAIALTQRTELLKQRVDAAAADINTLVDAVDDLTGNGTVVGGGDVVGPTSSAYTGIAEFADTSGKRLRTTYVSVAQLLEALDDKAADAHGHAPASATQPGFMSSADKIKLDGIPAGGAGSGGGNVTGPASSVNGELPVFSGPTGKVLAASGITLSSINSSISAKQATLVSGTNIKTINGTSLLGPGDVTITGGSQTQTKTRIVVLGDSLTAQTALLAEAWPAILERSLVAGGIDVEVHNLAVVGWDFYGTLTVPAFGTKTPVDKAISLNPDVVIVALGTNDNITWTPRTIEQVKNDAATVFANLRAGLPTAALIYGSELTWDKVHNPTGTGVLNRQVGPYMMEKPAAGILANCYSSEMLNNSISATMQARIARWIDMDAYIKGLATVDGSYTIDHYMANRLGLLGADGIHPTVEGAHFLAGCARMAFTSIPALTAKFPELRVTNYPSWDNPDAMRALFLTSSGGQWQDVAENAGGQYMSTHRSMIKGVRPRTWYLPSRGDLQTGDLNVPSGGLLTWSINNGKPNTVVELSTNGSAFGSTPFISDSMGNVTVVQPHAQILTGTLVSRARMGDEILGPVTFTVAAHPPASGNVMGPASATSGAIATYGDTSGKVVADSGRTLAQIDSAIAAKQTALVSGTSIKTIGGSSILGAGNIAFPAAPANTVWAQLGALTTLIGNGGGWTILASFTVGGSGNLILTWGVGGTSSGACNFATYATLSNGYSAFGSGCYLNAAGKYGMSSGCGIVNGVTAGMTVTIYGGSDGAPFQPTQLINGSYWTALVTRA